MGAAPLVRTVRARQSARMTSSKCNDSPADSGTGPAPEFHITIVFENEAAARRATEVCQRLMAEFDGCFLYQVARRSFAALVDPAQFNESLTAAQDADMIFVASENRLTTTTKRWLTDCLHQHADEPFALADMTAEGLNEALAIRDSWKAPGHHYGVDLIQARPAMQNRITSTTSSHSHIPRDWGINE